MWSFPGAETIPYHLAYISCAAAYGLEPWPRTRAVWSIIGFTVVTGAIIIERAATGVLGWGETAEIPLMAALMLLMVLHVRRRHDALAALTAGGRPGASARGAARAPEPDDDARDAHPGHDRGGLPRAAAGQRDGTGQACRPRGGARGGRAHRTRHRTADPHPVAPRPRAARAHGPRPAARPRAGPVAGARRSRLAARQHRRPPALLSRANTGLPGHAAGELRALHARRRRGPAGVLRRGRRAVDRGGRLGRRVPPGPAREPARRVAGAEHGPVRRGPEVADRARSRTGARGGAGARRRPRHGRVA